MLLYFHRADLLRYASPLILLSVIGTGLEFYYKDGQPGLLLSLLMALATLAAMVVAAVAAHRLFLLPLSNTTWKTLRWSLREWRFLGWWLILLMLAGLSIVPVFTFLAAIMPDKESLTSAPWFSFFSIVVSLPVYFFLSQYSMVLPATAVDQQARSLAWSWGVTKGNRLRLFVLLGCFPVLVNVLLRMIPAPDEMVSSLLLQGVYLVVAAVGLCLLSLCYQFLVGERALSASTASSYFDRMAEVVFKTNARGEQLYYPGGIFSAGRIIPDKQRRDEIFRFHKKVLVISLFLPLPYLLLVALCFELSLWWLLPPAFLGIYLEFQRYLLIRDLEKDELRLGLREGFRKANRVIPNWYFYLLGGAAVLMLIPALYMAITAGGSLFGIVHLTGRPILFSLFILALAFGLYKLKNSPQPILTNNLTNNVQGRKMQVRTVVLLFVLVGAVALATYVKNSNPYRKYSTEEYWAAASLEDVYTVPEEALAPGNRNGSVLMWAAYSTPDPRVIAALIDRGADVNEPDAIFSGTPLSSAAAHSDNPEVIDELIKSGAEINKVVGSNDKTPLIIAAELNFNPEIIARLIYHGADVYYKDATGRNAFEQAKRFRNSAAAAVLKSYM